MNPSDLNRTHLELRTLMRPPDPRVLTLEREGDETATFLIQIEIRSRDTSVGQCNKLCHFHHHKFHPEAIHIPPAPTTHIQSHFRTLSYICLETFTHHHGSS
jgi:hypothetical protein